VLDQHSAHHLMITDYDELRREMPMGESCRATTRERQETLPPLPNRPNSARWRLWWRRAQCDARADCRKRSRMTKAEGHNHRLRSRSHPSRARGRSCMQSTRQLKASPATQELWKHGTKTTTSEHSRSASIVLHSTYPRVTLFY
jgi:hypothetical protein